MPKSFGDFPSAQNMIKYINNFADHFQLRSNIKLNSQVIKIDPIFKESNNTNTNTKFNPNQSIKYQLHIKNVKTNKIEKEIFDGVVYANGHHWDKRFAGPFNNEKDFSGEIIHSKDYKNPQQLIGKRVLVIGIGNSGCDIAVESARFALKSHVSARSGKWIFPRSMGGIPMTNLSLLVYTPYIIQQWIVKILLKFYFGNYSQYGLKIPNFSVFGAHPTINSDLLNNLALKRIIAHPGIKRFCGGNTVEFTDGTKIDVCDLLVIFVI